jgi:hypothetical protein
MCAGTLAPGGSTITGTKYQRRNHQSSIGDEFAAPIVEQSRAPVIPSLCHSTVTQTPRFAGV